MNLVLPRQSSGENNLPAPFVFPPSGTFDGSDGPWSTFIVNVGATNDGRNGQNFKAVISTSAATVYVPLEDKWCTEPSRATCAANTRGIQLYQNKESLGFLRDQASQWTQIGIYTLQLTSSYDSSSNSSGIYGRTSIDFGATSTESPLLTSQSVVGVYSKEFPMGILGLSVMPIQIGDDVTQTLLQAAYDSKRLMPSLSYGFTAGARYRNKNGVSANLVFGGYDQSRFRDPVTMTMPGQGNSSLVIGVKSISVEIGSNEFSMTQQSNTFLATIDSTLPYLWLPQSVCDQFEDRFGLTYDNDTNHYIIEDSDHDRNVDNNPTIRFTVGNDITGSVNTTSISFPYSAFEQSIGVPIYTDSNRRYFPIKRSTNGVYVLGRTFLQEAYIVVDYERDVFRIGQAVFSDPLPPEQIIAILPDTPLNSSSPDPEPSPKTSKGAKAGIAVGVVLAVLIVAAIGFFLFRRRKSRKAASEQNQTAEPETNPEWLPRDVKSPTSNASELGAPASPKTYVEMADNRDPRIAGYGVPIQEMESPPLAWELPSPPIDAISSNASSPARQDSGGYFDIHNRRRRGHHTQSSSMSAMGLALETSPSPSIYELPGDSKARARNEFLERRRSKRASRGKEVGQMKSSSSDRPDTIVVEVEDDVKDAKDKNGDEVETQKINHDQTNSSNS